MQRDQNVVYNAHEKSFETWNPFHQAHILWLISNGYRDHPQFYGNRGPGFNLKGLYMRSYGARFIIAIAGDGMIQGIPMEQQPIRLDYMWVKEVGQARTLELHNQYANHMGFDNFITYRAYLMGKGWAWMKTRVIAHLELFAGKMPKYGTVNESGGTIVLPD